MFTSVKEINNFSISVFRKNIGEFRCSDVLRYPLKDGEGVQLEEENSEKIFGKNNQVAGDEIWKIQTTLFLQ